MMWTSTLRRIASRQLQYRTLVALPGANPLHVLQQECFERGFCDEEGKRKSGVDWRIALAMALPDSTKVCMSALSVCPLLTHYLVEINN